MESLENDQTTDYINRWLRLRKVSRGEPVSSGSLNMELEEGLEQERLANDDFPDWNEGGFTWE